MPSISEISWATSGMRCTSALIITIAEIMQCSLATWSCRGAAPPAPAGRLVEARDLRPRDCVVEQRLGTDRPADRADPDPVDVHDAHPGLLQPAQDLLRLLGNGGGDR